MTECTGLLQSTFPNCTVQELSEPSNTLHIEPTGISSSQFQYCLVIEDYIETLGFTTTVITEEQSYIEAKPL